MVVVDPPPPVDVAPVDPDQVPAAAAKATAHAYGRAARRAVADNASFLTINNPSNPQQTAQIAALTRQVTDLINLLVFRDVLSDPGGETP